MVSYSKTLQLLASKLGLSEEEKVLNKAAELERLLQTKTIAGSNLSDTSKLVICLDLAACINGVDLDVKTAIKYSGLKPVQYTSNRKTVENLLELNSSALTVPQLCVTLQCSGVQEVAEQILDEYRKCAKMELDLSLPQYVCMAVYQAARINKVKVSKVKINEKCRLKPAQWAKLEADWAKFVNEKFNVAPKKRGRPPKVVVNDENQEMEVDTKDEAKTELEIEPYEDWKRRMLETAYRELKELEKKQRENKSPKNNLPRERGTPQKEATREKELRGTPQKEATKEKELRGTPQKEATREKELRGTPQKEATREKELRETPQKEATREKELRGTQKSDTKENGTPRKEIRGTPQKNDNQRVRGTPQKSSTQKERDTLQKESRSAKKELLNVLEELSPRKSPRKTPQKFAPYTTPSKGNGVRLLFPKYM